MLSFYSFLKEEQERKDPKSKTLHSFDMDETLFAHDPDKLRIHVHDKEGNRVASLTNQEFNGYKLPPGHSYDFSDFRSSDIFGQSAKPIPKMIAKLRAIHKNNKNVEILTARSDMDDKEEFGSHLAKHGIDINQIHVRRAGNLGKGTPPENKKKIISQLIKKHGYTKVHLYDDSKENLQSFLELKKEHPDVEFIAHHVQHHGDHDKPEVSVKSTRAQPINNQDKEHGGKQWYSPSELS